MSAASDPKDGGASLPAKERATALGRIERAKRVRVNVEVGLHSKTNFFVGTSLNLSEGGLFVATSAAVPVGTEVDLAFRLPSGAKVEVHGVVRWRRTPDDRQPLLTAGVGVQFVDVPERVLEQVREFVEQRDPLVYGEE